MSGSGSGSGSGLSQHPTDRLIRELIRTKRAAAEAEIQAILERMATAAFNQQMVRVPAMLRGISYQGQTLGDRAGSLFLHLIRRVVPVSWESHHRLPRLRPRGSQHSRRCAMASLVETARIDALLDQLMGEWADVPEVATEFFSWDIGERLTYTEEWPLYDDKLHLLEQAIAHGRLTPAQCQRYATLLALSQRNRPQRDQMLG